MQIRGKADRETGHNQFSGTNAHWRCCFGGNRGCSLAIWRVAKHVVPRAWRRPYCKGIAEWLGFRVKAIGRRETARVLRYPFHGPPVTRPLRQGQCGRVWGWQNGRKSREPEWGRDYDTFCSQCSEIRFLARKTSNSSPPSLSPPMSPVSNTSACRGTPQSQPVSDAAARRGAPE